ncbi:hypothetical protein [Streptomyces griseus]|uniref:hypothetical protein n=1 Tax=Streptomyces griseus TaxID=1911 RepID=UPI0037B4CC3E
MNIATRLHLLDAVRRSTQADSARAAAPRAAARARKAAAAALGEVRRCEQQLAAARGQERQTAAEELVTARNAYAAQARRERDAQTAVRRTFTAARAANRTLAAQYAPYARGRDTSGRRRSAVAAGLLDELAAMPLDLIRAADVLAVHVGKKGRRPESAHGGEAGGTGTGRLRTQPPQGPHLRASVPLPWAVGM